jgi:hypothetical protein
MKVKDALWIVALSCLATLPAFLRAFPADTDPYYFLAGGAPIAPSLYPFVLGLIPLAYLPILCLLSTIAIAVTTYYISKEFKAQDPMLSVYLLFTASLFLFRQNIIEDDLIGYTLGLLGFLFWVRYWERGWSNAGDRVECIATSALFTIACSWFWNTASLMFVGFYVLHLLFTDRFRKWWKLWVVPLIGVMFLRLPRPSLTIGEQVPLMSFFVGLFILPWGAWMSLKEMGRPLRIAVIYWSGLGLLMGKFVPMAAPFLAVACEKTISGKKKNLLGWVPMLVGMAMVVSAYSVLNATPTLDEMEMCEDVASRIGGEAVANEWSYGHFLTWYGANPIYTPFNPREENYTLGLAPLPSYALTGRELPYEVVVAYPMANATLYKWVAAR